MGDRVLEFIKRRFPNDSNWLNGNCYYFALILVDRFYGDVYYDLIAGHFVAKIDGAFYDYSGKYMPSEAIVYWNDYQENDYTHANRIYEACVK